MEFELMERAAYRALSNEAFELRCQAVRDELTNSESEIATSDLENEVAIINEERSRRAMADSLVIEQRQAVIHGAGEVLEESGQGAESHQVRVIDRTVEALSSDEYVREFARYLSTRGAQLSPEFAQYQHRAGEGDGGTTQTPTTTTQAVGVLADAGILVPLTIQQSIIQKMQDRGTIWNAVSKTNVPGGIDYPVGDFKMEAHWIGEKEVSEYQDIDPLEGKVSFRYHQLEARHARTLMSEVIAPSVYGENYATAASNAMTDELENVIMNGSGTGKPLGIFADTRLTNTQAIKASDFTVKGYMGKVRNKIARLASGYRNGNLYMAETTFNYYFDGMVDAQGQPVARVNYGIDGEASRTLFGQHVVCVDENYIPFYDDALTGSKPFMLYGDLSDYIVNSNMSMRADRWEDYETNQFKSRLLMIVDGKVLDAHGFVKFTADSTK